MEYIYLNKTCNTIKVIIEPIFEEFFLKKNEVLTIITDDEVPIDIDIDDSNVNNVILTLESHFFYDTQIKKVDEN